MAVTRIEAACELGRVFRKDSGCEEVAFADITGRPCRLFQAPGSTNVVLHFVDAYRVLPTWQIRALICTLGRLLETGSMVDGGNEL